MKKYIVRENLVEIFLIYTIWDDPFNVRYSLLHKTLSVNRILFGVFRYIKIKFFKSCLLVYLFISYYLVFI